MVDPSKFSPPPAAVRTRRAYFDCRFGQLHVRTAFPTTGGFDEQVTLFCLHPSDASSRTFSGLLSEIADLRSAYAPDLPGYGESDPSPTRSVTEAAAAVSDLANDLRLRQIDLLGIQYGAAVALQLASSRPELVRYLLLGSPLAPASMAAIKHPHLILDGADCSDAELEAPKALAKQISAFLSARP
ncbi:MAG: alpha/beta fold hydrolase [Pseudomonadota bacterium]|nr:alpha/beta fold hydrolase [Pseudomonadota bacterium]